MNPTLTQTDTMSKQAVSLQDLVFSTEAIFGEKVHEQLIQMQQKVNGSSSSRLLNLREMLAAAFKPQVKTLEITHPKGAVTEDYKLDFGNMEARVQVTLYNHSYENKWRLNVADAATKHNSMLRDMRSDCKDAGVPAEEIVLAENLFARCFVAISQEAQYRVESDAGYWEVEYCDSRGSTQMRVTIALR